MEYAMVNRKYGESTITSRRMLPDSPFPRTYVHCVFDDLQDAMRGIRSLRAAGYNAQDINIMSSADYVEAIERWRGQGQRSNSLLNLFSNGDESFCETYLHEAHKGRHILAVRLPDKERMMNVRNLLIPHRARLMKYVDTWTSADLISA